MAYRRKLVFILNNENHNLGFSTLTNMHNSVRRITLLLLLDFGIFPRD
nr:MAG TPA: hypothetical protein [Caudoviricetes sp.]